MYSLIKLETILKSLSHTVMQGLSLWMLITITLAGCAAAMRISYDAALRRRRPCTAAHGCHAVARSLELQLAMGLFLVLPFLVLAAVVPSATLRVILNFTFCWVTPCKLLLLFHTNFYLDNPSAWTLSHFSHFLLAYLVPVRIKGMNPGLKLSVYHYLPPLLIRFSVLVMHLSFYDNMPLLLRHVSHCVALYLTLDLPHRIASIALLLLFGMETHPTFKSPWLSSSLTDFWGRRWDLTANALLRHTVYNPIINVLTLPSLRVHAIEDMEGDAVTGNDLKLLRLPLAVSGSIGTEFESHKELNKKTEVWSSTQLLSTPTKRPPLAVRLIGVNTTFFVSGLIHELLYLCATQGEVPTWEVTAFFIVQGMASSMEIVMRRVESRSANKLCNKIPRLLKVVLTVGFMFATATWLFFPQLVRGNVYTKCSQEHQAINQAIRTLVL